MRAHVRDVAILIKLPAELQWCKRGITHCAGLCIIHRNVPSKLMLLITSEQGQMSGHNGSQQGCSGSPVGRYGIKIYYITSLTIKQGIKQPLCIYTTSHGFGIPKKLSKTHYKLLYALKGLK